MTVRRTFLLLVAPLFLLLAGINSVLLFTWERSEAARGLDNQALAAAETTAAFAAGADDLAQTLANPRRDAALRAAAVNIRGLEGIYVASGSGAPVRIAGRGDGTIPGPFTAPTKPVALPIATDAAGRRLATALSPASGGRYVIAQIDAEPLFAEVAGLQRLIAALMAVAAVVGFGLAWFVASRIARELDRNGAMIAAIRADAPPPDDRDLTIRETHDLAHAVRLMQAGVTARLARGGRELTMRDRRRDEAVSVAAFRETAFPALATQAADAQVAVRMLGAPGPGAFYALSAADGRAGLVLGECEGATPAEALARALAARRFFERRLLDGDAAARVEQGRSAFELSRVAWLAWSDTATAATLPTTLAVLDADNGERAAAYAARGVDLSAQAIADDLGALLGANGVAAVLKPA